MIGNLQFISGNDIPFEEAQIIIHQPTIKEIAYIGEDNFFYGCELLNFSKDIMLNTKDKNDLTNYSNFDILMSIIKSKNKDNFLSQNIDNMLLVLNLLFPEYEIDLSNDKNLILIDKNSKMYYINSTNFEQFKEIISVMFQLNRNNLKDSSNYNPQGSLGKKIADKLKQRHQKLAEQKGDGIKISVFSRYLSILSVGLHKDMNSLLNYTVYQLLDEFERYSLYLNYDIYIKAKLAGAKDLKEPEDWMKDIHS